MVPKIKVFLFLFLCFGTARAMMMEEQPQSTRYWLELLEMGGHITKNYSCADLAQWARETGHKFIRKEDNYLTPVSERPSGLPLTIVLDLDTTRVNRWMSSGVYDEEKLHKKQYPEGNLHVEGWSTAAGHEAQFREKQWQKEGEYEQQYYLDSLEGWEKLVPQQLRSKITAINIKGGTFKAFPEGMLEQFTGALFVDLGDNNSVEEIKKFPPYAREINLKHNDGLKVFDVQSLPRTLLGLDIDYKGLDDTIVKDGENIICSKDDSRQEKWQKIMGAFKLIADDALAQLRADAANAAQQQANMAAQRKEARSRTQKLATTNNQRN